MSDATNAASPESLSDEDREKLEELKAQEAEEQKAAAEEAAAEAVEAAAAAKEEMENRPLFHVLIRHMGRSARTRTMRAG